MPKQAAKTTKAAAGAAPAVQPASSAHSLDLKATHAPIKKYYEALAQLAGQDAYNEGNVEHAFIELLNHCAKKMGERWTVIPKRALKLGKGKEVIPDATIVSEGVTRGYWEAKDTSDDLEKEIRPSSPKVTRRTTFYSGSRTRFAYTKTAR